MACGHEQIQYGKEKNIKMTLPGVNPGVGTGTRDENISAKSRHDLFSLCIAFLYIIQYTYFRTEPYICISKSLIIMLRVYREHIVLKVSGRGRTTDEISLLSRQIYISVF